MTEHDDAPSTAAVVDLLDEDTRDLFRRLLREALQQLIEAEPTAAIGAGRHERTPARSNWRDGGRPRTLATPVGDFGVAHPEGARGVVLPRAVGTAPATPPTSKPVSTAG